LAAGEQVAIFARRCQSGCGLMRQESMERRVARNSEPARLSGTCCSQPRTATGRALRAVAVGYLDAHLGCQLSGGDVTSVTVSGRPSADVAHTELDAAKLPIDVSLHELQRRNPQVRGSVAQGDLELEHHLIGGVGLYARVGQSRAGDVAAQLFQRLAVVGAAAHSGMQAETVDVGAQ